MRRPVEAALENETLVDALLREQQLLTPVAEFARRHERGELGPGARYQHLLPASAPAPDEQYAFAVELDKCSGCKACVTACHSLNGLDEGETWREVGLLLEVPAPRHSPEWKPIPLRAPAVTQHVTTACHHCVEPACLEGCPVLAYDKDPITGIVRHLDDQCIGCQYCILKCPYDVPKYNARLGIVRKCDMCTNRLAVGEAPACVQACPNEAIRITRVSRQAVGKRYRQEAKDFLESTPAGDYTLPTTLYLRSVPEPAGLVRVAADAVELRPQPAHAPLVLMLVGTQASAGLALAAALRPTLASPLLAGALGLAALGLGASVFHLGRPWGAWRAFLNFRRSWMSREILVFGPYPVLLGLAWWVAANGQLPFLAKPPSFLGSILGWAAASLGALGVFCSMMIYHDTRRALWAARRSGPFFFGTVLLSGAAGILALSPGPSLSWVVCLLALLKLAVEVNVMRHGTNAGATSLKKSAQVITARFELPALGRVICLLLGGVGWPVLAGAGVLTSSPVPGLMAFGLIVAGELIERTLFFTAVTAPKMPGGLSA